MVGFSIKAKDTTVTIMTLAEQPALQRNKNKIRLSGRAIVAKFGEQPHVLVTFREIPSFISGAICQNPGTRGVSNVPFYVRLSAIVGEVSKWGRLQPHVLPRESPQVLLKGTVE